MASATCAFDLLRLCGPYVKDIFYTGTSGWSPSKGGIINNGTCEAGAANPKTEITRIGDVCISPLAVNWDCRKASWEQGSAGHPNQCTFPGQSFDASSSFLFGQCQFANVTAAQFSLADEAIAASQTASGKAALPIRKAVIQGEEVDFWSQMDTGVEYPTPQPKTPPRLWTYGECAEIDSQFFYSGVSWDMVARSYVAGVMRANPIFSTTKHGKGIKPSQTNVVAVAAMEAIGLGFALEKYWLISGRRIPFTTIRGMSNWDHTPIQYLGDGNWTSSDFPEDFVNGYAYAIATSATVVMNTLKARCVKQFKSGCTFKIKY
jgi:hypothetical protein